MSGARAVRRSLAMLVVTAAAVAALPGLAAAAPPKRTPTPVVTAAPAAYSPSRSATFSFTDSRSDAVFACSLDGARATTCASPTTYTGLAETSHTFSVKATAPGLKPSSAVTRSWTVDVTPPAKPTLSAPPTPTALTTVSETFSSSSTDVASYRCSLDGGAATSCTSPKPVTAGSDGGHSFSVTAVDRAGNTSPPAAVAWVQDTATPVPVVDLTPATATTSTSATFGFASAESAVTFACRLDGGAFTGCSSPRTYTGLSTGAHTFVVRATDAVGNTAVSESFAWTVSPGVSITVAWTDPAGLPATVTSSTSGTFAFSVSGQTSLVCRLDAVDLASCGSPQTVSGLADGTHSFAVVANPGTASQATLRYAWTVDTTPPAAPTVVGPAGTVASTSADVSVLPSDPSDSVACDLDGVARTCGTPVSLTGLGQGAHTFTAVESDAAGNTASASDTWTVDTVAPTASLVAPLSLTGPVTLGFDEAVVGVAGAVRLQLSTGTVLATTLSCRDAGNAPVSCSSGPARTALLKPAVRLVPGEHYQVVLNPAPAATTADLVGNVAAARTYAFRGARTQQETTPAGVWSWRKVTATAARGGSYVVDHRRGASAGYTFTGTSVAWVTVTGPSFGWADLYVDGVRKKSVNQYATTVHYGVARALTGLTAGTHTLRVVVTGRKGATRATGTLVAVDAFTVGAVTAATPKLALRWSRTVSTAAAARGYVVSDLAGSSASLTFRGTGVTWLTVTGRACGKAAVYVDGKLVRSVDNFATTTHYRVARAVTGLTDARHTLKVVALGTHRRGATGSTVAVDAWLVR